MGEIFDSELLEARAEALVEHYQKTYELVHQLWKERSHHFIVLACVLAAAGFLTFVQNVIIAATPEYLATAIPNVSDDARNAIRQGFVPAFNLLLAFLVVSVFYLMANLCHRSGTIINLYGYLHALETEIRRELRIPDDWHAFTREGTFYRVTGSRVSRLIGNAYKAVLGFLLFGFFALRVFNDAPAAMASLSKVLEGHGSVGLLLGNHFLLILDVVIGIWTMLLFFRYATLSSPDLSTLRRPAAA